MFVFCLFSSSIIIFFCYLTVDIIVVFSINKDVSAVGSVAEWWIGNRTLIFRLLIFALGLYWFLAMNNCLGSSFEPHKLHTVQMLLSLFIFLFGLHTCILLVLLCADKSVFVFVSALPFRRLIQLTLGWWVDCYCGSQQAQSLLQCNL